MLMAEAIALLEHVIMLLDMLFSHWGWGVYVGLDSSMEAIFHHCGETVELMLIVDLKDPQHPPSLSQMPPPSPSSCREATDTPPWCHWSHHCPLRSGVLLTSYGQKTIKNTLKSTSFILNL